MAEEPFWAHDPNKMALHHAAQREGDHVEEVRSVLATGNDINFRIQGSENTLFGACYYGNLKVVQLLVENGIDFHTTDTVGTTPLMRAAKGGRPAVIEYLLDLGVDINAQNDSGGTALFHAADAPLSRREATVRMLLDRGINPTLKFTESSFHYTAARNSGPCEKVILDAIALWEAAHPSLPPAPKPADPSLLPKPTPRMGGFSLNPSSTSFVSRIAPASAPVDDGDAGEEGAGDASPLSPSPPSPTRPRAAAFADPAAGVNLPGPSPLAPPSTGRFQCGTPGPSPKRAGRLGPHYQMTPTAKEELAADDRESRARSARDLARYRERHAASASAAQ